MPPQPTTVSPPDAAAERTTAVSLGDGRRLVYAEYGDPAGVPVLLFHGTPGSRRLGALFDAAARERGVRVLAPDRPGFGRSSPWPDRSIRDAGRFAGAVLDDAGVETAGLVAFSGGGPHALATAATHGERVERVDVVAGDTPPGVSEHTPAVVRLLAGLASATPGLLGGLLRGQAWLADRVAPSVVLGQYTSDPSSVPDDAAAVVVDDFVEAFAHSRRGAVTEFRHLARPWGVDVERVDAPVCFRHGTADANVPIAGVRRLDASMPTARLRVHEGADHLQTLLESVPAVLEGHR